MIKLKKSTMRKPDDGWHNNRVFDAVDGKLIKVRIVLTPSGWRLIVADTKSDNDMGGFGHAHIVLSRGYNTYHDECPLKDEELLGLNSDSVITNKAFTAILQRRDFFRRK